MKLLIFRTILIYLCVWVAMRMMGKRQLSELQPGELVSTMLISNLASISIESPNAPVTASLIPLFLIAIIEILSSVLCLKCRRVAEFIQGRPKTVIRDGVIDQAALAELRLTVSELLSALRSKDVFDPGEVSCAIVETDGALSVAKRPCAEAATRQELAVKPPSQKAYIPFVLEGEILEQNLSWCGKTPAWVTLQLTKQKTPLPQVLALLGNDTDEIYLICRASGKEANQ